MVLCETFRQVFRSIRDIIRTDGVHSRCVLDKRICSTRGVRRQAGPLRRSWVIPSGFLRVGMKGLDGRGRVR